jgi:hypothetical protein
LHMPVPQIFQIHLVIPLPSSLIDMTPISGLLYTFN